MDKFKIDQFEADNPGSKFPKFYSLDAPQTKEIRFKLLERLSLDISTDTKRLLEEIASNGSFVPEVNANSPDFDLTELLLRQGIQALGKVYVNWYRYDDIDEFRLEDLSNHFNSIWYAGPDDIEIFDTTLSWVVSIRHDGVVSVTRIPSSLR
jgi:hypothetical protein